MGVNMCQTIFLRAKTPWSWGRMHDCIFSEREIESCRQLCEREKKKREIIYANLEMKNQNSKKTRSKAQREQETRFEGCECELNDH